MISCKDVREPASSYCAGLALAGSQRNIMKLVLQRT